MDRDIGWRFAEKFQIDDPDRFFHILPIGTFRRFGREVKVTLDDVEEMAAHFGTVPSTPIPVTKAHNDAEGKVGDVAEVEVRPDGLYARIDWLDSGLELLEQDAFQFFSPEIIWGPTDFEGQEVRNILIGLSLENVPFFGEQVALFTLRDEITEPKEFKPEDIVDEKSVQNIVDATLEKLGIGGKKEPGVDVEKFNAAQAENAQLKEELEKRDSEREAAELAAAHTQRVEKYGAVIEDSELTEDQAEAVKDLPELLASVAADHPDEAEKLAQHFTALAAQIDESALTGEIGKAGGAGETTDPAAKYVAMAEQYAKEQKVEMAEAFAAIAVAQPDLAKAYRADSRERGKGEAP